jgi:hypothetical protein
MFIHVILYDFWLIKFEIEGLLFFLAFRVNALPQKEEQNAIKGKTCQSCNQDKTHFRFRSRSHSNGK